MDLDAAVLALAAAEDAEEAAKLKAASLVADARAGVAEARKVRDRAIVDAYQAGARQRDIVARTGLTRESVRRILRAGGVEAAE